MKKIATNISMSSNKKSNKSQLEVSTRGLNKSAIDTLILLNLVEEASLAQMEPDSDEYRAFHAALEDMLNEPTENISATMVA